MKELTIEQKAKAYDVVQEKIALRFGSNVAEEIFSEFEMSEDERIRKVLVGFFKSYKEQDTCGSETFNGIPTDNILAWLEKQNHDGKKWIYEDVYLKEKEQLIQDGIDEVLENPQKYGLEKQFTPTVRTGLEWVNTIDDACDERYAKEYSHGEYCHEQSFKWGFQEGVEWLEKQGEPTDINPSEFDLRLNKLLKQFETLPKEELASSLSFYLNVVQNNGIYKDEEKQGEQNPIMNVPSREVILAIWDLGNEWKELTGGYISTEHGTQLNYIQKHWTESEYYLRATKVKQKPQDKTSLESDKEQTSNPIFKAKNWYVSKVDGKIHDMTYNSTDKVEPKFNVGDWITDGNITIQIEAIKNDCYLYCGDCALYSTKTADKVYHLWTIQDAKPGDVLAEDVIESHPSSFVAIFKKQDGELFESYCFIGHNCKFYKGETGHIGEYVHPATKEQCNLLFQKMHEAGWYWNAETKELSQEKELTSEQNLVSSAKTCKDAWSEEDEKRLKRAIHIFEDNLEKFENTSINDEIDESLISWLKTLKNRVQSRQNACDKEKSVEDEKMYRSLHNLIYVVQDCDCDSMRKDELSDWLESIKERLQ